MVAVLQDAVLPLALPATTTLSPTPSLSTASTAAPTTTATTTASSFVSAQLDLPSIQHTHIEDQPDVELVPLVHGVAVEDQVVEPETRGAALPPMDPLSMKGVPDSTTQALVPKKPSLDVK